ncbi:MAG: hypothetical protein Q7T20_06005 [Saprospiraceae bacterium]|nr:hypothetical protein [Saprospiraceae bacterium]
MNRFALALCPLLFALSFSACFEPKEGCLDIAATNFDAGADKDCCCEYPKIVLTVDQVYDTLLFRNDMLYPDANGHLFRIKSVAFYLSDFQLFQAGEIYKVSDTLTLNTFLGSDTSSQLFINDFQLVRRSPIDYVIGTFRQEGNFEAVDFRLGLSGEAQKVIPFKAPANHPLAAQADSLWRGQSAGFVFLQAVVVRDSMANTTADTLRFLQADLGQPRIGATGLFVHATGYDFPLVLKVDYNKMFEGINWSLHDIQAWKTKIIANLPGTFSVSQ